MKGSALGKAVQYANHCTMQASIALNFAMANVPLLRDDMICKVQLACLEVCSTFRPPYFFRYR
jgi:hypothetical protein